MRVKRFEDLECWQESRVLTGVIYEYVKRVGFAKDLRLSDQITGASISIMNNIAEGFDAKSNKEFIRFLTYSRRSCSEVQNCLYIALDQKYLEESEFKDAYFRCEKSRKIIDGLIRYLKTSQAKVDKPANRQRATGKPANG